ncbi:phytanoyl-CoA dioxygenase family protein [Cytobacillus firmus]|uniref:phytanoyl-CoA dioxygenase family protein n=1 Tax=Cytobacillus firmus TaxID=1399 RepID=UPI00300357BB
MKSLYENFTLTPDNIIDFANNGHILLRGVVKKSDVDTYRPFIAEKMKEIEQQSLPLSQREDTYKRAFLQYMNLWKYETIKKFILAKRFAGIAAALLQTKNVRLYYDSALYKEPGGDATPIHVDPFLINPHKVITMWMPLINFDEGLKSLQFLTGSHKLFEDGNSSIRTINKAIRRNLPMANYEDMEVGDATFHIGSIVHGAPYNPTKKMREVLTVTYYADGENLKTTNGNKILESHLVDFFPGLKPGDLAKSKNNPLIL